MQKTVLSILLVCITAQAQIKFVHGWNDWATHQPVLFVMANSTSGPIIECGCGDNSTEMLHEICKKTKRLLITLDDDKLWLDSMASKYLGDGYELDNSGWHKFFLVPGKSTAPTADSAQHWITFLENFDLLKSVSFDLCFVDQSPWQARAETIFRVRNLVKYVILHDCDYFLVNEVLGTTLQPMDSKEYIPGIYDFSKTFKYFKVYFPLKPWPGHSGPPTLLASNFEDNLPEIDYSKYE